MGRGQRAGFGFEHFANGGGFTVGQFGDQAGGAGFAADATFDVFGRRKDSELVAGFLQQFAATRRTAGKDDVRRLEARG